MSGIASESPRRFPVALVIGAQILLLVGIVLFALGTDWTASATGLLTVLGGPIFLVGGTLAWWRWGSRGPLAIADIWLGIYGLAIVFLFSIADVAAPGPTDWTPLVLGFLWLIGGFGGAIAVWRARR
jgi:hypothetical protein